jgi:hypothetical protein
MIYNVNVSFQYQVTAEDERDAAEIAREMLVEDIEHVYSLERGVEEMVKHSISYVTPGLDYDEVMRDIWENSDPRRYVGIVPKPKQ